jgi:hypothetical protein
VFFFYLLFGIAEGIIIYFGLGELCLLQKVTKRSSKRERSAALPAIATATLKYFLSVVRL